MSVWQRDPHCIPQTRKAHNLCTHRPAQHTEHPINHAIHSIVVGKQYLSTTPPNDIIQFPSVATAIVLVFNLPYGDLMTNTSKNLILDRNTTNAIFGQSITNWRDPRIVSLQTPDVAALLPNATIQLVVRQDSSGTTNAFQLCMNSFNSSTWSWGTASTWSNAYTSSTRGRGRCEQISLSCCYHVMHWRYHPNHTRPGQNDQEVNS